MIVSDDVPCCDELDCQIGFFGLQIDLDATLLAPLQ
jgi:hypothetical protein